MLKSKAETKRYRVELTKQDRAKRNFEIFKHVCALRNLVKPSFAHCTCKNDVPKLDTRAHQNGNIYTPTATNLWQSTSLAMQNSRAGMQLNKCPTDKTLHKKCKIKSNPSYYPQKLSSRQQTQLHRGAAKQRTTNLTENPKLRQANCAHVKTQTVAQDPMIALQWWWRYKEGQWAFLVA